MPIIQCDIREGRSEAQKRALAAAITKAVHETIEAPMEYIYVLIRETPGLHHIKAGVHLPDWEVAGVDHNESSKTHTTPD